MRLQEFLQYIPHLESFFKIIILEEKGVRLLVHYNEEAEKIETYLIHIYGL